MQRDRRKVRVTLKIMHALEAPRPEYRLYTASTIQGLQNLRNVVRQQFVLCHAPQ